MKILEDIFWFVLMLWGIMILVKISDLIINLFIKFFEMWKHFYQVSRTLFYVILVSLVAFFIIVWASYDIENAFVAVFFILGILFLLYVWGWLVAYYFAFRKFYVIFQIISENRNKVTAEDVWGFVLMLEVFGMFLML